MTDKYIKILQEKIDSTLDCFDFEKVYKVMKFLNWKWAFSDNEIPEIYELRAEARRLLNDVVDRFIEAKLKGEDNDIFYISTGGFTASILGKIMNLSFHVDDWTEENILNEDDDEV